MFKPRPNVDSAVIRLDIKENRKKDPLFYDFLHQCFRQRRKTLTNNLHKAYQIDKDDIHNMLNQLNIDPKIRSEALDSDQFKHLYTILKEEEYI